MALSPLPLQLTGFSVIMLAAALALPACRSDPEKTVCQQFKTGHFQFRHHEPGFHYSALIDRTDSLQIEQDESTGDVSTLAVKWTGDCAYDLRLISSTKPYPDSIQRMRKAVPLHTQILGGTADYYLFKCCRDNFGLVITDAMWVKK